ncbi:transposase [Streptomyces sp. CLV115]|uniref:transposase n=1 Tax=Streptomyces sp. CLV115 TaxID=3138502 RepID=UPI00313B323D
MCEAIQLADFEQEFIESYLSIGEYGPYPERLRQQFEGVIRRFEMGSQWREMPREFDAWSTVHNRFWQWRDAGVFEALLGGVIAEAAKRGEVDLSLVSVDSTAVRAHYDAAGTHPGPYAVTALAKEVEKAERARIRGGSGDKTGKSPQAPGTGRATAPSTPTPTQLCDAPLPTPHADPPGIAGQPSGPGPARSPGRSSRIGVGSPAPADARLATDAVISLAVPPPIRRAGA